MHTAKQPSYSECDEGSGIRLGFDCVAKCFLKASGSLARRIRRLTIKILGGAGGLRAFVSQETLSPANGKIGHSMLRFLSWEQDLVV
jgi:hypothetical protein